MTPLAHRIAKDALLPAKTRRYGKMADQLEIFNDLHCFECSAVLATVGELAFRPHQPLEKLAFLPARRTFIDFVSPDSNGPLRFGFLIEQAPEHHASVRQVYLNLDGSISWTAINVYLPMRGSANFSRSYGVVAEHFKSDSNIDASEFATIIYSFLAMINTPRIIVGREREVHATLAKRMRAAGLNNVPPTWRELVLEVRPPREAGGSPSRDITFTGARARHFVRCHLRIRLGQLELVSQHWRGDPALGTVHTKYAVVPPRDGVWPDLSAAA